MPLTRSLAAAFALLVVLTASCSGGDESSTSTPTASATAVPSATATPDPLANALERVSDDDLAVMVLPADVIGVAVDGFVVGTDSGPANAEAAADDTLDEFDTAEDWINRGYVSGYNLEYEPNELADRIESGTGVWQISTWVARWTDETAATEGLETFLDDIATTVGSEVDGVRVVRFDDLEPATVGDDTSGYEASYAFVQVGLDSRSTGVVFRVGHLTGGAWISRLGVPRGSDQADVERLATALESRIRSILLEEITARPVPIPAPAPAPQQPPPGVPDLAMLVLSLDDLPAGFSIDAEGYDPDPAGDAEYGRDFDAFGQTIGTSELLEFDNSINFFRTAATASAFTEFMADFFTSPAGRAAFADGAFSLEVTQADAQPLDLGDETIRLTISGIGPVGEMELAIFLVRVDNLMTVLIASGRADRFSADDIAPLAAVLADRLRQ